MVLYLIGLGLGDEKDVTVKGLEAIKSSKLVFLEAYTSVLSIGKERLSEFYGKDIVVADREMVESEADRILDGADVDNVAFLVVGDPFGATTHADLMLRAKERGIPVHAIHNASIMNAIGACGLALYNYGQTVSIVFWTDSWKPDSFYDKIKQNQQLGLHTLCLLDIKVREILDEDLARGRKVYQPPRFQTINNALDVLFQIEEKRGEGVILPSMMGVGVARIGQDDQQIKYGTLEQLSKHDFGGPLQSLILCGERISEIELDLLKMNGL